MLDLLEKCISRVKEGFVEMRGQSRRVFSVRVKDGRIDRLMHGLNEGACSRILIDGSWGFSSTTIINEKGISKIIEDAEALARSSKPAKRRRVEIAVIEPHIDYYESEMKRDPRSEDLEFLVEEALEVDKETREYSKSIASTSIGFSIVDDELYYVNSDGARIKQRIVRCFGDAFVIARSEGKIASAYESRGRQGGLEIFRETPIRDAALEAAERAVRIAPKRVVPGGLYDVVLENRIVGLLAHEAVGHTAEADLVYGGSYLSNKIGRKVASEMITLVDDGRLPWGFGTMKYDDEGVPTEKTIIIERGVVRGFMHSRETARQFGVSPTGNARAWSFEYDPIIRMRNTYIEPGDWTLEELIEDVKDGYFLRGDGGGEADFNGEFMFTVQEAVKIENGELKESYRGAAISGNAFEVLNKVKGVGRDFYMLIGMCGKEQPNYVGLGGPSLRTELLIGGQ